MLSTLMPHSYLDIISGPVQWYNPEQFFSTRASVALAISLLHVAQDI